MLRQPRGLTLDPKNKTVIVSDKYLNGVLTYSFPELFESPARQTAPPANEALRLTLKHERPARWSWPFLFETSLRRLALLVAVVLPVQ